MHAETSEPAHPLRPIPDPAEVSTVPPRTADGPYAAPAVEDGAPRPLAPLPHGTVFALAAVPVGLGLAGLALGQLFPALESDGYAWALLAGFVVSAGGLLLAVVNACRALARIGQLPGQHVAGQVGIALLSGAAAFVSSGISAAMVVGSGRGRQLRRHGRPIHAAVHDGSPWLGAEALHVEATSLADVAEAWRTNGKTEHASVAAFAELSLELVALGAPPALIADAHRDALDEMVHTEQCFTLARALDGRARGPRDFAAAGRLVPRLGPRTLRLAHLAVTSLYDGALYEGLSARVVAELAREPGVEPRIRAVLEVIARDEARHAAHGFDIVRWCLAEGGAPVARALQVAIDRARDAQPHALIEDPRAADGRWERWGIPGRAREHQAWALVRDRVVARTERLLGQGAVVVG